MVRYIAAGAACPGMPDALGTQERAVEAATLTAPLDAQDAAWNRGNIEAFIASYWPSPDLRFVSGCDVVRGFDETLARYQAGYPVE